MRQAGGSAAQSIAAATAEAARLAGSGFGEASRMKLAEVTTIRAAAEAAITKASAEAHSFCDITTATLRASVVPKTGPAGDRKLARDEVLRAANGKNSFEAVSLLASLAGKDDAVDAELLDGFTERLVGDSKAWATFRTLAVAKILQQPRHNATAAAISALARGHAAITADTQAQLMRIR
jgi:hypothetical protein